MMQARTISQLKAIMRGKDAGAFENLIKETNLLRTLGEYDFINYPLILNCFAKFNYVRKDVSEYLIKNTLLKLKDKKDDKTIKARAGLGFEGYSVIIRALSRCPYNEELWNLLEYQIFCTLPKVLEKFDQNSSFELVLIMSYFALVNHRSEKFWGIMKEIINAKINDFDDRSLAKLSFCFEKLEIGDEELWQKLEKATLTRLLSFKIQNFVMLMYIFSKMKKGSQEFWDTCASHSETLNFKEIKPIDFSQIVWSLSKTTSGSTKLWNELALIAKKNCKYFNLKDYNHIIFGFLIKKINDPELWNVFEKYIIDFDIKGPELKLISTNLLNEVLFISHVFYQKDMKKPEFWNKISYMFSLFRSNPEYIIQSELKLDYHLGILTNLKDQWDDQYEDILMKKLIHYKKIFDNERYYKNLVDFIFTGFIMKDRASNNFFDFLFDEFLSIEVNQLKEETNISGHSKMIALFTDKYKDDQIKIDKIIDMICKPENIKVLTKLSKSLSLVLISFSQLKNCPKFWNTYCDFIKNNKNIWEKNWGTIFITLIKRVGYEFNYDHHNELNEIILKQIFKLSDENKEKLMNNLIDIIILGKNELEKKFKDVIEESGIKKFDFNKFIKETSEKKNIETDIQELKKEE